MTPVFRLCDEYITQWAALDPVAAGVRGLGTAFGAATDYGPDGLAAWEDLATTTLAELDLLDVASDEDRRAASYLRERLSAELAWRQAGEPLRAVSAPFGRISSIRDSVDLLPRGTEEAWRDIAARLRAIPGMFQSWRTSLELGLSRGLAAARRQATQSAEQADRYAGGGTAAGTHDALVASYGDGPLAGELAAAAAEAHAGYSAIARWLREEYAPRAAAGDGVGADRYALAARLSLGADMDMHDAYRWGWEELDRVEAEMSAEADRVKAGATVAEATEILDRTQFVAGADAYLRWLQDRHDQAVDRLNGTLFDIPEPLRTIEAVLARASSSGAAYYTSPSEDFTRPGRTWWPVTGRDTFET